MVTAVATHAELTPRLVNTLYTDAMVLADEAQSYFGGLGRADRDALPALERVAFSCESLRATTRLMHVIAWLLTRRALAAGEISARQGAAVERRLGEVAGIEDGALERLPPAARAIAAEAADLYDRVRRLDHWLDGAAPPSPVTDLMDRLRRAF